jgi:hypothetical protein
VFDPSILGALLNNNIYTVDFENTTDEIMEEPTTEEE